MGKAIAAGAEGQVSMAMVRGVQCVAKTLKKNPIPSAHDDLIRELEQTGWTLRRTVGSHHIFVHATRPRHITVPHPKKDLGKGLVHKIRKQAGPR